MRSAILFLGVLLVALTMSACSPAADQRVVLLERPDDPTVTFKVWLRLGSQDDPAGKEGLAYLTGRMIAQGSTTENSYKQILEKLYPLAASYDVRVDREMTVLTGRTHKDNLDRYYSLFTDAYLRPAFAPEDFERLKSNQLNYLKKTLRYASDEELGKAALYHFVFEGTPYAHPPEGTVTGVESLTLEDVKNFYQTHYRGANATVALGGGFASELAQRFAATLDELPAGEAPQPPAAPRPPAFEGRHALLVHKPDADASISFGFPIDVRRGDREFYALWIANSWLGEHRNSASHLYQVIREARGMNYGDYSYIEAFPEGGRRNVPPTHVGRRQQLFEVWIRTLPNDDALFAVRAAMRELQMLVDNGMSEEQFELTRNFLQKYVLHFAETTTARLGYAVDDRFYGVGGEGHLARFGQMLAEISRDEVNAALKKHLNYDDVKIAIVTGDADRLKQALAADAPTPKTYGSPKSPEILEQDKAIEALPLKVAAERIRVVPVDQMFQGGSGGIAEVGKAAHGAASGG